MKGEASKASISRVPAPPLEHLISGVLRRLGLPRDTLGKAIDRVDIRANDVVIHIRRAETIAIWRSTGLETRQHTDRQILTDRRALVESGEALVDDGADLILSLPVRARFRGGEATVLHPSGMATPRQDPALIKALARAHQWRKMLLNGEARSIEALAKQFGLDRGHVGLTLNLAFLSPTIARAIVRGEQPPDLRLSRLLRGTIPLSWREQETVFLTATAAKK
jgi:hypothetical protein